MKKNVILIGVLAAIVLMVGCSKTVERPASLSEVQVVTTYAPQAVFAKSASYAFLRERPEQEEMPDDAKVIVRRVRDAIKAELHAKHYKAAKEDQIDYIVDYHIVTQYSVSILAERSQEDGHEWMTIIGVPDDFVQGALVIDIFDATQLKPVWRGLCNANIALDDVSIEEKDQRIRYAVQELLKTFPPQ